MDKLNSDSSPHLPPLHQLPSDRPGGKGGLSQAQLPYLISGLLNPENARAMLLQFVSAHVQDCFMKGEVRQGETQERKTHDKWRHPHARAKYDCLRTHLDDEQGSLGHY